MLELAPGVEARQEQQVLDELGHPHRLGVHPVQGVHGLLRQGGVTAFAGDELGVTADRGQRGAQLVGGVGHELAHLGLAALARRQSLIDVPEQRIERRADLSHFQGGAQILIGHALVDADLSLRQGLGGDSLGGAGHSLQRCQGGAHQNAPRYRHDENAGGPYGSLEEELGAHECVVEFQRQARDDGVTGVGVFGHENPVVAQGVDVGGNRPPGSLQGQQRLPFGLAQALVMAVFVDIAGRHGRGCGCWGGRVLIIVVRAGGYERQSAGGLPGSIQTRGDGFVMRLIWARGLACVRGLSRIRG